MGNPSLWEAAEAMFDHSTRSAHHATQQSAGDKWAGLAPEFVRSVAAERLKALGHDDRLRIVEVLARAPMNVGEIARVAGISATSVSRHLRVLYQANVVRSSRSGNFVLYVLADRDVARLAAVAYRGAGAQARRQLTFTSPR